jgi:two-component system sensor histidine kinase DesK
MTTSPAVLRPRLAGERRRWLRQPHFGPYGGETSIPCSPSAVSLTDSARSSLLLRLSTTGVVAYCLVFPVVQVGVVAADEDGIGPALWALTATAAYTPLFARHVHYYLRGARPPAAGWTLAAMTVVITGALPFAGAYWLPAFFVLAVTALIVLPWRWSLPSVAGLAVAQVPLALALSSDIASAPAYFTLTLLWRTSAVFFPLWLVGAVRQLETARRELAEDAVLRTRLRIDSALRNTVGTALASIVARGQRSATLLERDPGSALPELAALVETSRGALADTRRLLSGFHRPSLWAELETAAGLLAAAGVETRLALPSGEPPGVISAEFRAELRSITARLLRDDAARTCVIAVTSGDGQVRLRIDLNDRHLASMVVSAS